MARPINEARVRDIIRMIDVEGKSLRSVAAYFTLAPSTVHEQYHRYKKDVRFIHRSILDRVRGKGIK